MVCSCFSSRLGDRGAQLFGENGGDFFLPPLQPQIDDPHQRHLAVVHPLGQIQQAIFPLNGVVIALERRRRGPEQARRTAPSSRARPRRRARDSAALPPVCRKSRALHRRRSVRDSRAARRRRCARRPRSAPGRIESCAIHRAARLRTRWLCKTATVSCVSAKRLLNRSTVCGVSEISGTSTMAVFPRARVERIACR